MMVVFPNPMLTVKDTDLMIEYGSSQCEVHIEDGFLPLCVPQRYGFNIRELSQKLLDNAQPTPFGVRYDGEQNSQGYLLCLVAPGRELEI